MRGAAILVLALGLSACGGGGLKQAGEECTSASECEVGLQCDFGQSPPVCSTENTRADAAPDASIPFKLRRCE